MSCKCNDCKCKKTRASIIEKCVHRVIDTDPTGHLICVDCRQSFEDRPHKKTVIRSL